MNIKIIFLTKITSGISNKIYFLKKQEMAFLKLLVCDKIEKRYNSICYY